MITKRPLYFLNRLFIACLVFLGLLRAAEVLSESSPMRVRDSEAFEQMARFTLALEQVRQFYVESDEPISYEVLIDGAIEGMMNQLDRYSGFLGDRENEALQSETRGQFGGVGIVISLEDGWLTVVSPMEGTPGWDAGLLTDDRILEIDGESTRGISLRGAVELLRGEPGTPVSLKVGRPSEGKTLDVTLVRAVIEPRTVQAYRMLDDGIGYIRVTSFAEPTPRMLREELNRLRRNRPEGLILDLRGNPGGLLNAAVEVAGLFLPQGTLVVYTEGRGDEETRRREYVSRGRRQALDVPMVVLINAGSASGSEIVAGALRDHGRATLVGQQSFGKGSVQSVVPLRDGSAIRLTTAIYFTPDGHQIHEQGLEPDERVSFPLREWAAAQRQASRGDWAWREDPQVRRALEVLTERRDAAEGDERSGD
ncbi:MAG: S41 family peptidase [Verrucomicrobia bacterium]|nr:S41 family peptidase [Verrucomicrobiota bacterium]MCH8528102.1 S41 family peptidase [Kiritimatiellia bacterium]